MSTSIALPVVQTSFIQQPGTCKFKVYVLFFLNNYFISQFNSNAILVTQLTAPPPMVGVPPHFSQPPPAQVALPPPGVHIPQQQGPLVPPAAHHLQVSIYN